MWYYKQSSIVNTALHIIDDHLQECYGLRNVFIMSDLQVKTLNLSSAWDGMQE